MLQQLAALSSDPAGRLATDHVMATCRDFVHEIFRERHCAEVNPTYPHWRSIARDDGQFLAILGYRRAADAPLFLEHYLAGPIEDVVSRGLNMPVDRSAIVEIGCLAAVNSWALLKLWHSTAIALRQEHTVAVATLTAPVRRSLERLGLPMIELEAADPAKLPANGEDWGSYYDLSPTVCAGFISEGARALTTTPHLSRAQ
jgi:hypothetical protein